MNIFAVKRDAQDRWNLPGTTFALPMSGHVKKLSGSRDRVKLGVRPWGIEVARNATPTQSGHLVQSVSKGIDLGGLA